MFRTVGSEPPSVYWRRRLMLFGGLALLIVLLVVTVDAVTTGDSDGSTPNASGPTSSTRTKPAAPPTAPRTTRRTGSGSDSAKSSSGRSAATGSDSPSAAPELCSMGDVAVAAAVGRASYSLGQKPVVELQVTNTGAKPCVQDLADKQIVLRVYNGESRVWGSHDCQVQSGTMPRTLAVDRPVRVSITWSGFTSNTGCTNRQRVGAGTYTLYATLSGKAGKAAQFSIS